MTKGKVLWEHIVSTSDLYAVLRVSARKFDNFSYRNIRLFFEYHKINERVSISLIYFKKWTAYICSFNFFFLFFVEFAVLIFPGNIGKLLQFNYLQGNLWDSFFIYSQVSNTVVVLWEVLRHPYQTFEYERMC